MVLAGLEHQVRLALGDAVEHGLLHRLAPADFHADIQSLGAQRGGQLFSPGTALREQVAAGLLQARTIQPQGTFQGWGELAEQQVKVGLTVAGQPGCTIECRLGFLSRVEHDQQLL